MKISLGMRLQSGPWGGGNQFAHSLVDYCRARGDQIFFDLRDPSLDVILLTASKRSATYTCNQAARYLLFKNRKALVVYRVNECDERKGTRGINKRIMREQRYADHTVFISKWLQNLFCSQGLPAQGSSIILNGASTNVFNSNGFVPWNGSGRLRIVTHHWGDDWLKGFDIYRRLDDMLDLPRFRKRIEFSFVGKLPKEFAFKNTRYIQPLSGDALARVLRSNHVYLTASQNEPAGMHHIEGALCGLPLLYRESGALPEYCRDYGIAFTEDTFEEKLLEMLETYHAWPARLKTYPHTAEAMCAGYYDLFLHLQASRKAIIKSRKPYLWVRPLLSALMGRG